MKTRVTPPYVQICSLALAMMMMLGCSIKREVPAAAAEQAPPVAAQVTSPITAPTTQGAVSRDDAAPVDVPSAPSAPTSSQTDYSEPAPISSQRSERARASVPLCSLHVETTPVEIDAFSTVGVPLAAHVKVSGCESSIRPTVSFKPEAGTMRQYAGGRTEYFPPTESSDRDFRVRLDTVRVQVVCGHGVVKQASIPVTIVAGKDRNAAALRITSPAIGASVGMQCVVEGSRGTPMAESVRLIVINRFGAEYEQDHPVRFDSVVFRTTVDLGDENGGVGDDFQIIAVAGDGEGPRRLRLGAQGRDRRKMR